MVSLFLSKISYCSAKAWGTIENEEWKKMKNEEWKKMKNKEWTKQMKNEQKMKNEGLRNKKKIQ